MNINSCVAHIVNFMTLLEIIQSYKEVVLHMEVS